MKKASFSKLLLALMLVFLLVLAACSGGSDEGEDTGSDTETEEGTEDSAKEKDDAAAKEEDKESEDGLYSIEDFSTEKTSEGEAIDGGTLNFGLVSSSVFEGTLNWNFYSGAPDAEVIEWFDESLLSTDENFTFTQDGAATFEVNEAGDVFTFTINENVNWHDGEPVTAEDWAYSFEVIADPDYDGVRYGNVTNVVGVEEYHDGEADTISGLEIIDDKTLQMTFKQASPSLLASGIWPYAMPKHVFEDIPVAEMSASDAVRVNPIGMGPFKVESIVPGESVTYTANEDYWQGAPKLDGVTLSVVGPQTVAQALESGEVDLVDAFPTDQYPDVEESLNNVEFLGNIDMAYTYIGFKLGSWDADNKKVQMNPDAKVADVELRRAMWHAVDNDAVANQFYNGLRWNATTLIPPSHPAYHDETIEAPTFDLDLANQILDEAGYEDVDGDGMRENPEGEELVLNFASMEGGDTAEPIANYYIQSWGNAGINVQLVDGRLLEFNAFYDRIGQTGEDDPAIDIYQGAWGVGSDVDPTGLYGPNELFNFPRYENDENEALLADGVSPEAMDTEYRTEVYSEWQALMVNEIPVFPTLYRAQLVPVNNRVQGYSVAHEWGDLHEISVTAEEPVVAE
ncbi:oligopeptide ABC transporter substrate-binding protein [Oceanobacillus longus]|uniref:Oligopeptide ABC transporter substrate-binding protein n=1 Tax=Oceanobacillus longus TaxID=930120 RepID=A0ABV8GYI8_9BACI